MLLSRLDGLCEAKLEIDRSRPYMSSVSKHFSKIQLSFLSRRMEIPGTSSVPKNGNTFISFSWENSLDMHLQTVKSLPPAPEIASL